LAVVAAGVVPGAEQVLVHVFYSLLAAFVIGNFPKWIAGWRGLFEKPDKSD